MFILLYIASPSYCSTQHLHFGFFFIVTCSTCIASPWGFTVTLCTSTAPGEAVVLVALPSLFVVPFKLFGVEVAFSWVAFFGDSVMGSWTLLAVCWWLWSLSSRCDRDGGCWPGVGVIGLPPLINSTISSASRLRSPPGRKGLSHPLSTLQK